MKIAIVHDWLISMRGAERCVESMCRIFPQADIFTLFHEPAGVSVEINSHRIITSSLNAVPRWRRLYRNLLPLMPFAIERFDLKRYDVVISSSSCVAKGVVVPGNALHISYVYSPMRYAWDQYVTYFRDRKLTPLWKECLVMPVMHGMRIWDVASGMRPDVLLTVSEYAAKRVKKCWGRSAKVVYPPVEISDIPLGIKRENFYLMVTTFEPNKHVDLAIRAFNELKLPLKIVGNTGRFGKEYQKIAAKNITFLGWLDDATVQELYSKAQAVICPSVDDFGIVPVEAIAAGTPVIAFSRGGIRESVVGVNETGRHHEIVSNGVLFDEATPEALVRAVQQCQLHAAHGGWDRQVMRQSVERFDRAHFEKSFKEIVVSAYNKGSFRNRTK